jgi:radical SAM superfamily enzyme
MREYAREAIREAISGFSRIDKEDLDILTPSIMITAINSEKYRSIILPKTWIGDRSLVVTSIESNTDRRARNLGGRIFKAYI